MVGLQIVAVGKLKEAWMREGCAEYTKRLGLWSSVAVTEIDEARLGSDPSPAEIAACIEKEGARILEKIPRGARVVALCIEGRQMPSEALAAYLSDAAAGGCGSFAFVIGGSHGLSDEVKRAAALRLSISPMTFPHQLARLLLLEQLYRACAINAGTKYHK